MNIENQKEILLNIKNNFIESTGYCGWTNYDIYSNISSKLILHATDNYVKKLAYDILIECASIRYSAQEILNSINAKFPELKTGKNE